MTRAQAWILWSLAALLGIAAIARAARPADPYRAGAQVTVDDRRAHRFRDQTWSQAERLLQSYLQAAERAPDPVSRARALARVAVLQHERGFAAQAAAAANEAMRLAPADTETRRVLASAATRETADH